jgi:hypothetical protein
LQGHQRLWLKCSVLSAKRDQKKCSFLVILNVLKRRYSSGTIRQYTAAYYSRAFSCQIAVDVHGGGILVKACHPFILVSREGSFIQIIESLFYSELSRNSLSGKPVLKECSPTQFFRRRLLETFDSPVVAARVYLLRN